MPPRPTLIYIYIYIFFYKRVEEWSLGVSKTSTRVVVLIYFAWICDHRPKIKFVKMLKYQTTLGDRLRKIIDVLSPILVDGNLTFDKTGLTINGQTDSLAVKLELPTNGAEFFQCWSDKAVSIGLDFRTLSGWLKAVNKGDIISFEVTKEVLDGATPMLTYKHWNDTMNHEVRLPILDIDECKFQHKAEKVFDSILSLDSGVFDEFVKRHGVGGDKIRIHSEHNDSGWYLVLHSYGTTPGETTKFCYEPNFTMNYNSRHKACDKKAVFKIKTMRGVCKAYTIGGSVNIHLNPDGPIVLVYPLGQMGSLEFRVRPEPPAETPSVELPIKKKRPKPVLSPKKKRKKRRKTVQSFTLDPAEPSSRLELPPVTLAQVCGLCGLHVFADQGVGFNAKDPYGLYHPDCIMK